MPVFFILLNKSRGVECVLQLNLKVQLTHTPYGYNLKLDNLRKD